MTEISKYVLLFSKEKYGYTLVNLETYCRFALGWQIKLNTVTPARIKKKGGEQITKF